MAEHAPGASHLPPLALGGRFGERSARDDFAILDAWHAAGGELVETGHAYAEGAGERRIGEWLRRRRCADEVGVVTKVGHPRADGTPTLDAAELRRQVDVSRQRLGVDQLALLLLHRDDPAVPVARFACDLVAAADRGGAKAVGVANWSLPRLEALRRELSGSTAELGASSEQWSLARPRAKLFPGTVEADDAILAWHASTEVPLLAWSANAGGWFAGRCDGGPFDTPANRALRGAVADQAAALAVAPATVALHHALRAVPRMCAVIGPESPAELGDALLAVNLDAPPLEPRAKAAAT